jgi:hypothetical protein
VFSKESAEYIENGYYQIENVEFYSIWTFKNKFKIGNNTNEKNKVDATNLGGSFHLSIPDKGNFSSVKLFSVNELKAYYFN